MKLKDYIEQLQVVLQVHGNLDTVLYDGHTGIFYGAMDPQVTHVDEYHEDQQERAGTALLLNP